MMPIQAMRLKICGGGQWSHLGMQLHATNIEIGLWLRDKLLGFASIGSSVFLCKLVDLYMNKNRALQVVS